MKFLLAILVACSLTASAQMGFMQPRIGGTSLVGWWTLNSTNAGVAEDSSGFGNTGFLTNSPAIASGRIGASYLFSSSFVNCGAVYNPSSGGSVTMSAWVNASSIAPSFRGVVAKRTGPASYCYAINMNNATVQVYTGGSSGVQSFAYALPTNQWVMLTGVISSQPTAFYTNGVLFGTAGSGGGLNADIGGYVMIGTSINANPSAEYFIGSIDDVRIYNRALTAAEIKQLYGGGYGTQQ